MEIDTDKLMEIAIRDGMRDGIKDHLSRSYDNPLDKMIAATIAKAGDQLRSLLDDAVASCVGDPVFRDEMRACVRAALAKTLVSKFGGEMEKQVNALKSDPTTRARITLAVQEICQTRSDPEAPTPHCMA